MTSKANTINDALLDQINKRFTLNLLIQGAATHTCLTAHHLVADELSEIDPSLVRLYDRTAIGMFMIQWRGDLVLVQGRPAKFWRKTHKRRHPFHRHPLLALHGGELSEGTRRHIFERARRKGACRLHGWVTFNLLIMVGRLMWKERRHKRALERLAAKAVESIWGIPAYRLEPSLTMDTRFGHIRIPKSLGGMALSTGVAGYGGVLRFDDAFRVIAKAWVWPILSHELVKATTELVCLHGINTLDDETYRQVMNHTDRIEFENRHMQAGAELWRRLLSVIPDDKPLAQTLMHIVRLEPKPLESLMFAVVKDPDWARELIASL